MGQRPDTIKLEENIGRTLFDINHSKIFYDPPFTVMEIKAKINIKVKVKSLSVSNSLAETLLCQQRSV